MTVQQAIGLGALQGATEFLPISSSGHLVLAQNAIPGLVGPLLLFDVVVHLGTLFAILIVYRRRVGRLLVALFSFTSGRIVADPVERRWLWLLAAGSLPTAAIGLGLKDTTEQLLERPAPVGAALLVTAAILVLSERFGRRTRDAAQIGLLDALVIGAAQGLAVIPGISRSGATVGAALGRHVDAEAAVEFSLLLSIPAISGAGLLLFLEHAGSLSAADLIPLAVGFTVALGTGLLALQALKWAVTRRKLFPFAIYCVFAGLLAMFWGGWFGQA